MSSPVVVHKHRTVVLLVNLGVDVSNDVLVSEIRANQHPASPLIATWQIEYVNDGSDGELRFTLDDLVTAAITAEDGYMDIKRISNGEPLAVFQTPLEVRFREPVTA